MTAEKYSYNSENVDIKKKSKSTLAVPQLSIKNTNKNSFLYTT